MTQRAAGGAILLLIEGHEDTRKTFTTALRLAGYRVYAVATYPEAREVLDAVPVAVVILDISRGKADLADALTIRTRRPPPRLIAVTDRAPETGRRYTLFETYILKPCLPEHLVQAVEKVLAGGPQAH